MWMYLALPPYRCTRRGDRLEQADGVEGVRAVARQAAVSPASHRAIYWHQEKEQRRRGEHSSKSGRA